MDGLQNGRRHAGRIVNVGVNAGAIAFATGPLALASRLVSKLAISVILESYEGRHGLWVRCR
jgi:hypothetical protein